GGTVHRTAPLWRLEVDVTARGITFDFHNTIAACESWFQLEVRQLVSAFLGWHAATYGTTLRPGAAAAADAAYRRLRQAIHIHGHELSAERCVATVLERIGIRVELSEIARGIDDLMREALKEATPLAGAVETVRTLAEKGVSLGIVSSAVHHPFLEWTLERFGILDAFAVVTTSASSGYYKSRPEIYWQTLQRLGAVPGESVHVGDSKRFDVGGAQRAGMRAILVAADHDGPGVPGPVPDLVLPSLRDAAHQIMGVLEPVL
ncbi:MAG: putative hydrolase of the superfamily, partial [Thermomicrobiales bacterium]|nr:putative hydrolase of the superfamily [Thermomicrobiales bacterium]